MVAISIFEGLTLDSCEIRRLNINYFLLGVVFGVAVVIAKHPSIFLLSKLHPESCRMIFNAHAFILKEYHSEARNRGDL